MSQNVTNATNATNATGASGLPVESPGGSIADRAVQGGIDGLNVAAQFAGDIVRAVVPDFVLDRIPFLLADAIDVMEVMM